MGASAKLFLQERDIETQKEEHNSKLTIWNQLTLKKLLSKSSTKKKD